MTDPAAQPLPGREQLLPPRPLLVGALASLLGWAVVLVPIIAVSAAVFAAVLNPETGLATVAKIALISGAVLLLLCMVAAPHFLGQALIHRERALWRATLVTGLPTVGVVVVLLLRWLATA